MSSITLKTLSKHFGTLRALDEGLDALDERISGVDVDAGLTITNAGNLTHVVVRSRQLKVPPPGGTRGIGC